MSLQVASSTTGQYQETIQRLKNTVTTQQSVVVDVYRELRAMAELMEGVTDTQFESSTLEGSGVPEVRARVNQWNIRRC